MRSRSAPVLLALLLAAPAAGLPAGEPATESPSRPVELDEARALLLTRDQREAAARMDPEALGRFVGELFADPLPDTPENELEIGIERRQMLVHREFLSFADDRARLLFLLGSPAERLPIDCGQVFVPLEIWSYPQVAGRPPRVVLYRPNPSDPYRLWLPLDSKRVLYTDDMAYWLQQWEELGRRVGRRFDLQVCPSAELVDQATGVDGLRGFQEGRPGNNDLLAALAPPGDLAAWARRAAATPLPELPPRLATGELSLVFPERIRQRIVTRFQLILPPDAALVPVEGAERTEVRLNLEGVVEQGGELFEEFRVRYELPVPGEGESLALVFERALRPQRDFLLRFRLTDVGSGAETIVRRSFRVPPQPEAVEEPPLPEAVIVSMGEELSLEGLAGEDSLLLAPPSSDVVLGVWRAEALVTGERIEKVVFLVDGKPQLTRTGRPFSAEVRLAQFPREQVIRAEGYDAAGNVVAADEVVVNRPRGAFRVRIESPRAGVPVRGTVVAAAEIWVPEDRVVSQVEFRLNEETLAVLTRAPWQVPVEVPPGGEVAFLTVVATLDDGQTKEEVRYLNAPQFLEEVDIQLVELLTTVTDGSRRPVADLDRSAFQVREDGRVQEITRFELVKDVPLTVGITIDTSGSMMESLGEAKEAATGFLEAVLEPKDRAFAVSFAKEPRLLVPPTDDVEAVGASLEDLQSVGWTALHDAVVSSLYYFRAFRGQRALILLSDGDDSASYYPFRDSLEYARRSGVVIYTVGLDVGAFQPTIRRKLRQLAEETGGRSFFISRAEELRGVYREIEEELRSQYLLAYASDNTSPGEEFREVEVTVLGGKLTARTIRGYYP